MTNAQFKVPDIRNEPVKAYREGSPEKAEIKARLARMSSEQVEIPVVVGGKAVYTGNTEEITAPHDHSIKLGVYHKAGAKEVETAIEAALEARHAWASMPWEHRATVFLKAAEMLAGPWRSTVNAATMLGQSKTVHQAEIDAACELIDFWRFNVKYMAQIMADQPDSSPGIWNRVEYRPLEGFVLAITPFNFTSIGGNLPTAPAVVGNVVLWKPASSAVLSNWYVYELLREAGLPDGVINFIPGSGREIGGVALASPDLAGVHFTGSTGTFNSIWRAVSDTLDSKKYYPRLVGETGGKDFIFAHSSADVDALVTASVRGAFEYQGQKCSAASRAYIPRSLWGEFEPKYVDAVGQIKMGDTSDFTNFMGAVIDRGAFRDITEYIDYARESADAEFITGGSYDDSKGLFIEPTTIVTTDPCFRTMEEEIFGPVLTMFVYEDADFDATLDLCNTTSPYALTGAVFAQDRSVLIKMADKLRDAAGNFYFNDKPTGAVVGQQPFGGARGSGTNDKAGSAINLLRWMSVRTIKEALVPPTDWRYPFMEAE